jgi:hypothetical protein
MGTVCIFPRDGSDAAHTNAGGLVTSGRWIPQPLVLETGWNLISLPYIPSDNSVDAVFGSINGKYSAVACYDAFDINDHWKVYSPNKTYEMNDLKVVDQRMGIWLYITNPVNITISGNGSIPVKTTIILKNGWNLMGYPSVRNRTASEIFSSVNGVVYEVQRFDRTSPHKLATLGEREVIHMGFGYWVYVSKNCHIDISWN